MKSNTKTHLYDKNVALLYDYGYKKKLVVCNSLRRSGFEDKTLQEESKQGFDMHTKPTKRGSLNDTKLDTSLSRTKSTIFELAYCNPWDLFITLTLNPAKYDRTDLKGYQKGLTQWIRDYNKKYNTAIKYLLIPELHDDHESWHMHGFIMGLPEDHLSKNKNGYLDWKAYSKKFGFMSLDFVRNHEAVAKYVTKYVTKDTSKSVSEINAKKYYCSKGLNRKVLMKKGTLNTSVPYDFTNEFVNMAWFDTSTPIEDYIDSPMDGNPTINVDQIISQGLIKLKNQEERKLYEYHQSLIKLKNKEEQKLYEFHDTTCNPFED